MSRRSMLSLAGAGHGWGPPNPAGRARPLKVVCVAGHPPPRLRSPERAGGGDTLARYAGRPGTRFTVIYLTAEGKRVGIQGKKEGNRPRAIRSAEGGGCLQDFFFSGSQTGFPPDKPDGRGQR